MQRQAAPTLCVRYASASQRAGTEDVSYYSMPIKELIAHPEHITAHAAAEVPALVYPEDSEAVRTMLRTLKDAGLSYGLAENIGAIRMICDAGLVPIGGYGLNVTNSDALDAYRALGVAAQFASFELTAPMLRDLKSAIPLGMIVAGRLPLMQLRACPARTDRGCGTCGGRPVVSDRKNAEFPLLCMDRKYSVLLNSVPLYLGDKPLPPLDFYAVYLTTETAEEAKTLIDAVRAHAPYKGPYTTGLAFRKLL